MTERELPETWEIFGNTSSYRKQILLGFIMNAVSVLCIGTGFSDILAGNTGKGIFTVLTGIVGLAFFGFALWFMLRRLRTAATVPIVTVTRDGITDHSSAIRVGLIRWENIETLTNYTFQGQRMLGIIPRNWDPRDADISPIMVKAITANVGLGCPPLNIAELVLPFSVDEFLAYIKEYSQRYDVGGHIRFETR
jgi:hypothetical protein